MNNAHAGRIFPFFYNSNPKGRVMADMMPAGDSQSTHGGYELVTTNLCDM